MLDVRSSLALELCTVGESVRCCRYAFPKVPVDLGAQEFIQGTLVPDY